MNAVVKGYLRLCRPPNLPTAAADILAGIAISGFFDDSGSLYSLFYLLFSSVFLYAGGVVFNDVFDYNLDCVERPERPLPSGLITRKNAAYFGGLLFIIGFALAAMVSLISAGIAFVLILSILLYDSTSKDHAFFGPLNMGLCRGLNLLLGFSIVSNFDFWTYTLIPVLFIFAVTLISRGEVHGKNKKNILLAAVLYGFVIFSIVVINYWYETKELWYLVFLGLFIFSVYTPLLKAYRENIPKNIMKAVKAGVLSIILLDAAIAVGHANVMVGVAILLLLPLSLALAKIFAVT